ncbi:hypothetical protein Tco_0932695 [Tanacetum coccineum]
MAASTKALILEYAFAPTPPSPLPSPLSPLSFPLFRIPSLPLLLPHLHTSPTYARAPLSYRASIIPSPPLPIPSPPLLLPFANRRSDIPEADMSSQKRLCLTTPTSRFEVSIRASEGRVMTAVEEVNERVTDLAATERHYFRSMSLSYEREVVYAQQAWSHSEDRSIALEALIRAHEARITALDA